MNWDPLVTHSAGPPFWILQCYENLDMLCTEFLPVYSLPSWLKTIKRKRKKEGMASHDHIQDFHTLHLLVMQSKAVKESKVTFELRQEVNVL